MTTVSPGYGAPPAQARLQPESVVPLTAIYPIARVDLMPPEILAQRRFRRARGLMITAVVVTAAAATVAFVISMRSANVAAEALAAEQLTTGVLTAEAATYDDVPRVLSSIDRAETALEASMTQDIQWFPYLYQLSVSAPQTVWFEKITFTLLTPGVPVTDPLAPQGDVATVSTTGRALAYPDVVSWVQEMDAVSTWEHALLVDAAAAVDTDVVTFTSTALISADAYSGRFSRSDATDTGTRQ